MQVKSWHFYDYNYEVVSFCFRDKVQILSKEGSHHLDPNSALHFLAFLFHFPEFCDVQTCYTACCFLYIFLCFPLPFLDLHLYLSIYIYIYHMFMYNFDIYIYIWIYISHIFMYNALIYIYKYMYVYRYMRTYIYSQKFQKSFNLVSRWSSLEKTSAHLFPSLYSLFTINMFIFTVMSLEYCGCCWCCLHTLKINTSIF